MTDWDGAGRISQPKLPGVVADPHALPPTAQKKKFGEQGWWRMKDGWLVEIPRMSHGHLKRCIKMMIRSRFNLNKGKWSDREEEGRAKLENYWHQWCTYALFDSEGVPQWTGNSGTKIAELVQELRKRPRGKIIRAFEDHEIREYLWDYMLVE